MFDDLTLSTLIASAGCSGTGCPTVYATNRGTRIIQGDTVAREAIDGLPAHESGVEVPLEFYDTIGEAWARERGLLP
jgi:hypothetical protein